MDWSIIFGLVNVVALLCWAALILLPRSSTLSTLIFYVGIGLLCLIYGVLLVLLLTGAISGAGEAGFTSIEGIRSIFRTDAGVVVGWTHYLAFDLFVGLWISRDADNKHFSRWLQAPILLLTFVAGPLGLLVWYVVREPAARRAARSKRSRSK